MSLLNILKRKKKPEKVPETKETRKVMDTKGREKQGVLKHDAAPKEAKSQKSTTYAKYIPSYKILLKPLVTEKAAVLGAWNQYVFQVAGHMNKKEVAKAIRSVYNVDPVSVHIIQMQGKQVRYGRVYGKRKDWKKAIVTLKKGDTIEVYEGV